MRYEEHVNCYIKVRFCIRLFRFGGAKKWLPGATSERQVSHKRLWKHNRLLYWTNTVTLCHETPQKEKTKRSMSVYLLHCFALLLELSVVKTWHSPIQNCIGVSHVRTAAVSSLSVKVRASSFLPHPALRSPEKKFRHNTLRRVTYCESFTLEWSKKHLSRTPVFAKSAMCLESP